MPDGRYNGLWGHALNMGRAFYTNTPAEHPAYGESPSGHIALESFLAVPVMNGAELLGQIVAANAAGGYGAADLEIAQRLAGFASLYFRQWRLRERLQASAAQLRRHNCILSVVADTASRFLRMMDWDQEMAALLAGLGQALDASRAFIFENYTLDDGEIAARCIYSWAAPGLGELTRPEMTDVSYAGAGLARWAEYLSSGKAIAGQVKDFPLNEQAMITRQGTKSLLAMPIFTGYDWYGYLGFGSHHNSQDWSTPEVDALQAAAGILGAAIERRQAEAALRKRTEELERFEKLVVGRELKMIELKQRIQGLEKELQALKEPSPGM
jgi:GAF domain-containing protein